MRQAVERFERQRSDERYVFKPQIVRRVVGFFRLLRHFEGSAAGKPFVLEPWQQFICAAVYGLYYKDTGQRLINKVYLEVARKNGKTAFAAGLCLLHLVALGEAGPEVYLAANSREQAMLAYKFVENYAHNLDPRGEMMSVLRRQILFRPAHGQLRVLASDSSKLDGPNPSMFLLDEFHAARDTRMKDVLQSGQGMREAPMQIITTTAGFDKLSPCYIHRTTCTEILAGVKTDERQAAFIFSLDDEDDWHDSKVWAKSNPNIGVTVHRSYLEDQITAAGNNGSEEVGIRTKNLNQWVDAQTVWIPDHYVLAATRPRPLSEFKGREVWAGIDLSSTSDLTCFALMVQDGDALRWWLRYYLPREALSENRFRQLYGEWARAGWLILTPGNVVDYDYILNDLRDLTREMYLMAVAYDSWNATQFVINATEAGLPMEPYSQTLGAFNKPTKEFERLILSGRALLDDNEITRHCIRNVVLARDRNGNTKPSKQWAEKKIDGIIVILESLGVYLQSPHFQGLY